MIERNDPCWCGSGKKWKKCHSPEISPAEEGSRLRDQYQRQYNIILKTPEQIEGIRKACRMTADVLDACCRLAKAGVTTNQINTLAVELGEKVGARAACLHYGHPPFPKAICTSLNEVICHGIPDNKALIEGDIMNIDVSFELDGYYGDCSRMVVIGKTDADRQRVVDVSYDCLMQSIAVVKPGVMLSEIGNAIEKHAHANNCSVVHQFVAHGVGLEFHEAPQIPHYANELSVPLAPGMTFTIEPMINAGVAEGKIDHSDQWTARTLDSKPSAQWEHTLLVTSDGCEILTLPP